MRRLLYALVAIYVFCAEAIASAADTAVRFDPATGLFIVKHHTVEAARGSFAFWNGAWAWSGTKVATKIRGPLDYGFSGISKNSTLTLDGTAQQVSGRRMEWRFSINTQSGDFGGISFKFDLAPFAGRPFIPVVAILPGKEGWSIKLSADETPIRVTIDPKPADVAIEEGRADEIRVYFARRGKKLSSGEYVLAVDVSEGTKFVQTGAERLASPDSSWYKNLLQTNIAPVDLSFLNQAEKPAGKRGALGVKGDKLVFADGTEARFWGTNVNANALFQTSFDGVVQQARRLSQLGFNLVRIHHFDSAWVRPNILGRGAEASADLDPEALRKLDWWIKALGDQGIYVWIDLNAGRIFSDAHLEHFGEMAGDKAGPQAQGFSYVSPGIEAKMSALNSQLLDHVNEFTGLAYHDDPRIAFLLVSNENDLSHHFGNLFLPDKKRPELGKIYMSAANSFAQAKGVDSESVWKSWRFGPAKLFLNDVEHRFNKRMIAGIKATGSRALTVTTSSWGGMTAAGLPSLTDGDVVDVHSYQDRDGMLETDPRFAPNLLSWIGAAGIAGQPLTVSEWNMGNYPSYDRAALPGYIAAVGSFQDWAAMMQFAYSQSSLDRRGRAQQWEMVNDPALLAMMPVGALIFRQQHVKPGETIHYLRPAADDFIDRPLSPITSRAMRTLTESVRWRMALPEIRELDWFKPSPRQKDDKLISNVALNMAAASDHICAETGEFCRNWQQGVFTIDTPMTQLASGWIGGESIGLTSSTIAVKTGNAVVAIQSLDARPITASSSILVSMAAQSVAARDDGRTTRSEPVIGHISFTAPPGLKAYVSFGDGRRKPFPVKYENGRYHLDLDASLNSYWIVLRD